MTKAEIIDNVHSTLGLTKKDIAKVVDDVFVSIKSNILAKEKIKISGFGNFEVKLRGRRVGRNPKTGEEKVIEPRNVVVFVPSQLLKNKINGK